MSAQRMNNADAAWLHMDRPTNLMIVHAVLWFDEPLDLERATEVLRLRFVEPFPRFRQRVVEPRVGIGAPSWQDDSNFDLGRHLHHIALPAPGDKAALEELVGDLMVMPLDRSKALWDVYLIDGFGSGMAMMFRIHHCTADGIALSRVLLSLTDQLSDTALGAPRDGAPGRGRIGSLAAPVKAGVQLAGAGLHEGIEFVTHPATELTSLARSGTAEARALAKLLITGPDAKTVLSGKLGVARRVTWSEPIPLVDIKKIGEATGTTVNDVLVAAMTGALHRYLSERDSLVDEIRVLVPFNLRPLDEPLPPELGNRFGFAYLTLPVGVADAAGRLAEVHRRMKAIKRSPESALSYGILEAIGLTPLQIEQRLLDVFAQKISAVLTNVPGPPGPLSFAGTTLAGVVFWVPAAGTIGMGISIFSYNGGVIVGLQVDPGLVPDPDTIIADYEHQVATLDWLATRHRTKSRARSAAPARPRASDDAEKHR